MGFAIFDERNPSVIAVTQLAAASPGATTILTANGTSRRYDAILVSSTDTVDRTIALEVLQGATATSIGQVVIPAGSGTGAIPPVDLIAALPLTGQAGIVLGPADSLRFSTIVATTAAKQISLVALGGTF